MSYDQNYKGVFRDKVPDDGGKFTEYPECCDAMPISEFKECVDYKAFIDSDGFGFLGTETHESEIRVWPSELNSMLIPDWATHVGWYNK